MATTPPPSLHAEATSLNAPDPAHGLLRRILDRNGIEPTIAWGYLAVTLFMTGDGLESGFLSAYLHNHGFASPQVANLWGMYGLIVAISSWLAGVFAGVFGPKRVMIAGGLLWAVMETSFLIALANHNYPIMLISFSIRALGYPLFSYSFLVWITIVTAPTKLGKAVGWYWFFSTLGLGTISALLAEFIMNLIGQYQTLWITLILVFLSTLLIAVLVRDTTTRTNKRSLRSNLASVVGSLTIAYHYPRVGAAAVYRAISTLPFYSFIVFLGIYMEEHYGFTPAQWQIIWGAMLTANVFSNMFSGYLANWLGYIPVISWGGGIGCLLTTLAWFYSPHFFGPSLFVSIFFAALFGVTLGFGCPLAAITSLLVPTEKKAQAVALINLGAGCSQFLGPVVARLIPFIGTAGTVWFLALMYIPAFVLGRTLRLDASTVSQET